MKHLLSHSKDEQGNAYIHLAGLGVFQVPEDVQAGLNEATDEWLLDNLVSDGLVQPFIMAEVMNRGIYWRVIEREQAARPKFSIAKFLGLTEEQP
jgi:hypothetical protein